MSEMPRPLISADAVFQDGSKTLQLELRGVPSVGDVITIRDDDMDYEGRVDLVEHRVAAATRTDARAFPQTVILHLSRVSLPTVGREFKPRERG